MTVAACAHEVPAPEHVRVPAASGDDITVSWIGHATVLIGIRGHWFLTDPVFADRLIGIEHRSVAAAIAPSELPRLDAILISHAHVDHLDLPSLRALADVPLLIPPGARVFLDRVPQHDVIALDTGASWTRGDVTITAVPASHGDGRWLVDFWRKKTHTGWMIQVGDRTVYFAGDTGFVAREAQALRHWHIDVGIIPVGPAGRPHWLERWRRRVHVTPDAAMDLFAATGAQWMVPIHYGTFFQPAGMERPIVEAAIARHHEERWVRVLAIGETTRFVY